MLNHSDCDFHIASYAREIARVNSVEWMRPARPSGTRTSLRVQLGSTLVALGTRLAPEAS